MTKITATTLITSGAKALSLTDVAKASGASVFHFCKVFKKTTGLTFTDYVARTRLEGPVALVKTLS